MGKLPSGWPLYQNDREDDCVVAAIAHAIIVLYGVVPTDAVVQAAYKSWAGSSATDTRWSMWRWLILGLAGKRIGSFGTRAKDQASIIADVAKYRALIVDLNIAHTVMLFKADAKGVTYVSNGAEESHAWPDFLATVGRVWAPSRSFDPGLLLGALKNNKLWWLGIAMVAAIAAVATHVWTRL